MSLSSLVHLANRFDGHACDRPMGLDQWWSKGDGVSGKVVHQIVQQAAPLRLLNTDDVPIRTITSGNESSLSLAPLSAF
jgi:hypothetical protein